MADNSFESIKIGLASPEKIRSWSYGEVTKPETINYRTLRPEKDGLFCEKIFGPTKDWECLCGKYKRVRYKGKVCEHCGVEVTTKKVRRERMGHIELAAPVSHIWYFKAIPSKMALVLEMTPRELERVLYFMQYVVLDPGMTTLEKGQVLTEEEYNQYYEKYENDFRVGMGAEAIKELLQGIEIEAESKKLKDELLKKSGQQKLKIIKRLEVIEGFRKSGNKPEWMILDCIPVIPPDIRPMVPLDGGRYATSDLNDLYRRVINRNNRLKKIIELNGPPIIIRNEKRMLQEAVDALIDNGRRGKPVIGSSNRELKSLSEMLRGKQGRFRQNLLGKRVDYSGRSVIVVGPSLKIYQCGLPKEMALELFKPFIMKRLVETQNAINIKEAKKKIEKSSPEVWDALENVIKDHPVLLNRAPTLHRLSIQAFEPVLVEGRAIKLHPLVCAAFNADFDGDQMPIHVPLSSEAQAEARFLMLSANNFLKPVDGKAVTVPSQDMVLGSYYLTIDHAGEKGEGSVYRNFDEAMMAYENGELGIHAPIKVRVTKVIDGVEHTGIINATLGRLIFNQPIPQDLGFVDRSDPSKLLDLEIDFTAGKKELGKIVDKTIKIHGPLETARVLDAIKENGYKYSTKASLSISFMDIAVPDTKKILLEQAQNEVDKIQKHYNRGEMTDDERYKAVIALWEKTTDDITNELIKSMSKYNPITMMSTSGARGSMKQMRQLAGMRGLISSTTSRAVEIPIKTNFREGMNVLEYFIGAKGSRKALSDTALKTADSGYLTRRLVDVSQEVIVREIDCGTRDGIWVSDIIDGKQTIESLEDRLVGRFAIGNTVDVKGNVISGIYDSNGNILVNEGEMITSAQAKAVVKAGIDRVYVRSILKCKCKQGVCAHCYGIDLATSKLVSVGEAVGIIAAQSIGEPGTQLTMRTFHTGGVAGSDITQGLPRVEELFEARKPKKTASIAKTSGVVKIVETKRSKNIVITSMDSAKDDAYPVPYGTRILVEDGAYVQAGDPLTEGTFAPTDISTIKGIDAAYDYLTKEVQRVYRGQDIEINDKHIEVITRQMTRKVRIDDGGDTDLLPASVVDVTEFNSENEIIQSRIDAGERDIRPATATPLLLGITKAALQTESFLSAASFQETTKVLTEAAIKGKVDHLVGLKENVIIGKLIPAGTGLQVYRDVEIEKVAKEPIPGYGEEIEDAIDSIDNVEEAIETV